MVFENLIFDSKNNIATITLNRPDKLNALNMDLLDELYDAFVECEVEDEIQAVILTGAGEKAFAAGADIEELAEMTPVEARQQSKNTADLFYYIEHFPKPVIAAVNGFCLGGGNELAMACHMRWASQNAKFGQPEVNLGLICGYGGSQRLARLIGKGRAIELLISGAMIDAKNACDYGLVNHVVEQDKLLTECEKFLQTVMKKGPLAVQLSIDAINRGLDMPLDQGIALESELFGIVSGTQDMKEGTAAFMEKRKPNFTGE
ncbi:MAG: hypothetical protein DWQ05_10855 [Calditrichaeota bacterium]|nr:MAG: hypothetical protein DWQ05_10855 [Calditrichota bacterium]